jgi:hypothetical protein
MLFAAAIFIAAAQMFWGQPMLAKMLLPTAGGRVTPHSKVAAQRVT